MGIPFVQMACVGILPSFLKVAYYRMRGARIGKNVRIAPLSVLMCDDIEIGDGCRIGMLTFVRARKLRLGNRVRIGSMVAMDTGEVAIGHDSVIMEQTVVGGMLTPRSSLFIGCRVKVFPYCFLNPTESIVIEDDVGVGGSTYLFTHGSWQSVLDGFPIGFGPIHLRRGVWLPWRVFILPNVEVGEYATIGAGAVINRSIPANALAAGMPAKVLSADGKYLRPLDGDARWSKVLEIVSELAQFLSYQGQPSRLVEAPGSCRLEIRHPDGRHDATVAVHRCAEASDCEQDMDALVSMDPMPTNLVELLDRKGIAWFDIASARTSLGGRPVVEHLRNFFSRYGVRFAVAGDPPFSSEAHEPR